MKTILVLAANPENTQQLRLEEEFGKIKKGLEFSSHQNMYVLYQRLAVRRDDIRQAILEHKPNFLHFAGHGSNEGIYCHTDSGQVDMVTGKVLADLLSLCGNSIECVIFNSCYTETLAEATARHVNYVIGVSGEIEDEQAIRFSAGFYDALGVGEDILSAHKFGCNNMGVNCDKHPVLKCKSTLDEDCGDGFVIKEQYEDAECSYQNALDKNLYPPSLITVRLHRKLAMCCRKQGKNQWADEQHLKSAIDIIRKLRFDNETRRIDIEKENAFLELERAYWLFEEEEWANLKSKVEDIIELYEDSIYQQESEFRYILGNSYDLLALSFYGLIKEKPKLGQKLLEYWAKAEDFLIRVVEPGTEQQLVNMAEQKLIDIKVNRCAYNLDKGNYDTVIKDFDTLCQDNRYSLLPKQRQMLIKHNLAAAYIDRQEEGDILKAYELGKEYLSWAKLESNNANEWIWALKLNLRLSSEQIRFATDDSVDTILKKAKGEIDELNVKQVTEQLESLRVSPDGRELGRLVTELYIAAGRLTEANAEFRESGIPELLNADADILSPYTQPSRQEDDGDIYLTHARLSRLKRGLRLAESSLEEAIKCYGVQGKIGKQASCLIELAYLYIEQKKWQKAKTRCEQAREISKDLMFHKLKERCETLLISVNQRKLAD